MSLRVKGNVLQRQIKNDIIVHFTLEVGRTATGVRGAYQMS